MTTLGRNTGNTLLNWPSGYVEVNGPFTATASGSITDAVLRVDGSSGGGTFRVVVYADSSGLPGAKVATSAEVTVTNGQAAGNVTATFSSGSIVNGSVYWLGFETGTGTIGFYGVAGSSGTARYVASATYPTAPDPFGSGTAYTDALNIFIDFSPAASVNSGFFQLIGGRA